MSVSMQEKSLVSAEDGGFDRLLGSSATRYLGDGHRRVGLVVGRARQTADDRFVSAAQIAYPVDWSVKAGQGRVPHLSTVDVMRIAEGMRDQLASEAGSPLADFPVQRSLEVRAGARPWENLDEVPIATEVEVSPDGDEARVRHVIGSLKVDTLWGPTSSAPPVDDAWLSGAAADVTLLPGTRVQCTYRRRAERPALMSFLEAMMLAAQMSQVALYDGDYRRREVSGNMWMRRAAFVRHRTETASVGPVDLQLKNRRTVTVGGSRIDTAEVLAPDVFGVQVTASLASAA